MIGIELSTEYFKRAMVFLDFDLATNQKKGVYHDQGENIRSTGKRKM